MPTELVEIFRINEDQFQIQALTRKNELLESWKRKRYAIIWFMMTKKQNKKSWVKANQMISWLFRWRRFWGQLLSSTSRDNYKQLITSETTHHLGFVWFQIQEIEKNQKKKKKMEKRTKQKLSHLEAKKYQFFKQLSIQRKGIISPRPLAQSITAFDSKSKGPGFESWPVLFFFCRSTLNIFQDAEKPLGI